VQYEITRLQAIVRGKLAHQSYNLKLGCAIIIQATMRQCLAKKAIDKKIMSNALVASRVQELRDRNSAKRIQFWWKIVLDWMNEKKAALTIERFFIHVRAEVDREVNRREFRKSTKKEQRRKKRHDSEEKMLERAWLNTVDEVDETKVVAEPKPEDNQSEIASRSKSAPRLRGTQLAASARDQPHRTAAPGMNHRMPSPNEVNHKDWPIEQNDSSNSRMQRPTDAVRAAASEDFSEVSNITNPSVFHRMAHPMPRQMKTVETDRTDEVLLEHAHRDVQARQSTEKKLTTEDYIKKYGGFKTAPKTAPNRIASGQQPKHFFSEDGTVTPRKHRSSSGTAGTPSKRLSSNGTPRSSSQGTTQATTPRSSSSSIGASSGLPGTPRSHVLSPSPRGQQRPPHSSYPPVTPTRQKGGVTPTRQKGGPSRRDDRHNHISRRETAETESQTTFSQTTFSKASPRSRPDGQVVHGGSSVMVMKTYPNFTQTHSIEEAQELMYLGDEYGEV
jgi:hypothetical protein